MWELIDRNIRKLFIKNQIFWIYYIRSIWHHSKGLFVQIQDILDCRIDATLKQIEHTEMIELPEEPIRCEDFIEMTNKCVAKAVGILAQASSNTESYVMELISLLEQNYRKEELDKLKHAARAEHNPVWYYNLTAYFCQRNTEAFVKVRSNWKFERDQKISENPRRWKFEKKTRKLYS